MSDTKTPLTDAAVLPRSCHWERELPVVFADFARPLEPRCAELERIIEDAQAELVASIVCGFLYGNHDEPIDEYGKRLLRVVLQRFKSRAKREGGG